MRLLLDTHLLLWAVAESRRLPGGARALLEDPGNDVYFSAASIWEIAIKSSLRRRDFRVDMDALRAVLPKMGLTELPVSAAHAAGVVDLAPIHGDPFDRMLVAQSIAEPLILLTNDAVLARYSDGVRVV
ncbi:MAG: type II toxin-antitoxin system VapC family toxin [Terriglobia bacterium]